jgi:peptide/nickel transport system permease protein
LAVVATIVLAVLGARNRRGVAARIGNFLIQGGSSVPVFWLGLLLVYLFYYVLRWAPAPLGQVNPNLTVPSGPTHFLVIDSLISGNWTVVGSALAYLVLPAVSLAVCLLPTLLQTTRSTIEEVLDSSYIKTMKACGLASWRLYIRYVLRNSLVSFIIVLAMTFGYAVGGAVLVEEVFQWPGVGFYAVSSMTSSDYAPVVGIVLVSAIINVTLYNIADVVSAIIDPRISL